MYSFQRDHGACLQARQLQIAGTARAFKQSVDSPLIFTSNSQHSSLPVFLHIQPWKSQNPPPVTKVPRKPPMTSIKIGDDWRVQLRHVMTRFASVSLSILWFQYMQHIAAAAVTERCPNPREDQYQTRMGKRMQTDLNCRTTQHLESIHTLRT